MTGVLITGIEGFAGSHLAELLLSRRYRVYGTVLNYKKISNIRHLSNRIAITQCDIRDADRVDMVIKKIRPDHIYHLAGIASVPESFKDPGTTYRINFWGTYNLLESVRKFVPGAKVLIVGSAHEYGWVDRKDLPVRETHALNPNSPYGASKAAQEMLALQYYHSYGMKIFLVRAFNHIGPRQSPAFVLSDFARQIAEIISGIKAPVVETGNLEVYRDFTDVRDVVEGYLLIINRGAPGDVYNVCSGIPYKLKNLLKLMLAIANCKAEVKIDRERLRKKEMLKFYGDNTKLRKATGWQQKYNIERTLKDMLEWWHREYYNSNG